MTLHSNRTWSLVVPPPNANRVSCWVFKIKRKGSDSLDRKKAKLVVRGFNQMEGVSFFKTFSLAIKFTTVFGLLY